MSTSGPTNAQARKLLQTLCKFIIPLAQSLDMKAIQNLDDILLGVDADAFVNELEDFLSGGTRPRKEDRSLTFCTVQLKRHKYESIYKVEDPLDYLEGADWFWEKGGSSSLAETREISAEGDLNEQSGVTPKMYYAPVDPERDLQSYLGELRQRINLMPIRVLGIEPFGSKFKISLLDQNAVYNRLYHQMQADWDKPGFHDYDWTWISSHIGYAILSHTWTQTPGELTYVDWQKDSLDSDDPKCQKIINFCKAAYENHGLTFGWVDTVCINKESSSELDESIRSMYKWYSYAKVCITYLGETDTLSDMASDSWFTRGWTFQELVAPELVKFYNKDWEQLVPLEANDKLYLPILESIQSATEITPIELEDIRERPYTMSISRRMELAARRKVTRKEDVAYSLMGIFNVSISTAYGEGEKHAFFRLLKEIFDTNKDVLDIFNWGGYFTSGITSLFPEDIHCYANHSTNPKLHPWRPIEPLTLTHVGLRTLVLLMSAELRSELDSSNQPVGDYHAAVSIMRLWRGPDTYHLLQAQDFTNAMGVLNVEEHDGRDNIRIPKTCFAVFLEQEQDGPNDLGRYKKTHTRDPIVFTLEKVNDAGREGDDYYVVKKDQLENHGMKLVTLYL